MKAAFVKLKDHLWYLSERLVPLVFFSVRVADRDKKEMANAILKYQNQVRTDYQQMPETEDFEVLLIIGGQYCGTFLVPVPSVLLWYRYRGTLLFFGGTGVLVLFYFLVRI